MSFIWRSLQSRILCFDIKIDVRRRGEKKRRLHHNLSPKFLILSRSCKASLFSLFLLLLLRDLFLYKSSIQSSCIDWISVTHFICLKLHSLYSYLHPILYLLPASCPSKFILSSYYFSFRWNARIEKRGLETREVRLV